MPLPVIRVREPVIRETTTTSPPEPIPSPPPPSGSSEPVPAPVPQPEAPPATTTLAPVAVESYAARDPLAPQFMTIGVKLCNVLQYFQWMKNNPDGIGDEFARCSVGIQKGYILGGASPGGDLDYEGQIYKWRDLEAAFR